MEKPMTIERVRELLEHSTPGPWEVYTSNSYLRIGSSSSYKELLYAVRYSDGVCGIEGKREDLDLAAVAPELAKLCIFLHQRIKELEEQLDCKSGDVDCSLYERTGVPCYRHIYEPHETFIKAAEKLEAENKELREKVKELEIQNERMHQRSMCIIEAHSDLAVEHENLKAQLSQAERRGMERVENAARRHRDLYPQHHDFREGANGVLDAIRKEIDNAAT